MNPQTMLNVSQTVLLVAAIFVGLGTILAGLGGFGKYYFRRKVAQIERQKTLRPHISIKPGKIKYGSWTDREKADDPGITERCDKIILYFWMRNTTDQPASNVDMNVTSQIIDEKGVGNLSEAERNTSDLHSLHLLSNKAAGKQPFILALDKKAINHFKNGAIKVQLVIRVDYTNLNNTESYWSEGTYIYSPTFEYNAIEVSSGGI